MESKKKALSIVTICRNDRANIRNTLNSVISQRTDQVEYVVVDGASTDGTKEIVLDFQEHIDRVISEPDSGLYNAINKGILASHGRYVGLVHSGDQLRPGAIQTVLGRLDRGDERVLYGGICTFLNGDFMAVVGPSAKDLPEKMIPHPGTFVPRSFYDKYGLYDESYRIAADYKLFLNLHLNGVPFEWLDALISDFDLSGVSSRWGEAQREILRLKTELGVLKVDTPWQKKKAKLRKFFDAGKDLFRGEP